MYLCAQSSVLVAAWRKEFSSPPNGRLYRNVIPRREPRNLKILRPAQDDSSSLRGACPELVEGLEMTNRA